MDTIHNWKETSPIPDLNINIMGAGSVQTSKRYYEWWLVYKLQTMVNKAWAELTMVSQGGHDI